MEFHNKIIKCFGTAEYFKMEGQGSCEVASANSKFLANVFVGKYKRGGNI